MRTRVALEIADVLDAVDPFAPVIPMQRVESTCTVSAYETDTVFDSLLSNQDEITKVCPLVTLHGKILSFTPYR